MRRPHSWLLHAGHSAPPTSRHTSRIGRATAYRFHDQATTVLASQAPDLHEALQPDPDDP